MGKPSKKQLLAYNTARLRQAFDQTPERVLESAQAYRASLRTLDREMAAATNPDGTIRKDSPGLRMAVAKARRQAVETHDRAIGLGDPVLLVAVEAASQDHLVLLKMITGAESSSDEGGRDAGKVH